MSQADGGRRTVVALGLALVLVLAAGLRLEAPSRWPMFLDEEDHAYVASHIREMPSRGAAAVWAARETGKPPLLPLTLAALARSSGEALLAGRILSALAGTATAGLCFLLGVRLAGLGLGLQAAFLYAVCPWGVLHERLAIHDGLLTLAMTATLLLTWRAAIEGTWRSALVAAAAALASAQIKQSGVLVIAVPVLALILTRSWSAAAVARAGLIAILPILSIIVLSTGAFAGVNEIQSGRWQPLANPVGNAADLLDAARIYLPAGLGVVALVGIVAGLASQRRFASVVSLTLLAWTIPWPLAGPFAPSRYYLPAIPLACALAPFALEALADRFPRAAFLRLAGRAYVVVVGLFMLTRSIGLVRDAAAAPLPKLDAQQYQGGWASGFGLRDACAWVFERAEAGAQIVPALHPRHRIVCADADSHRADVAVLPFPDFRTEIRLEPYSSTRPLYLVVDDTPDWAVSIRILRADPRIAVERIFRRPGGGSTVLVLRRPAMSNGAAD